MAYELYHLMEHGYDFYGEGMSLFDEGGGAHASSHPRDGSSTLTHMA